MRRTYKFTVKNFNNLIGGGAETIQNLHNYNHITPDINNQFVLCKYDFKITVNQFKKHGIEKALIIYNNEIFGYNGNKFIDADLRTRCNVRRLGITYTKKAIASYNRQEIKPYILILDEQATLNYDSYWYNNILHRCINYNERINLNNIKYYKKNMTSSNLYIQAELKNGLILEGVKKYSDVPASELNLIVDKSGYNIASNRLRIAKKYNLRRFDLSLPKMNIAGWKF